VITRLPARLAHDDRYAATTLAGAAALAYVLVVCISMGRVSYNTWAALLLVPLLGGGSFLVLRRLAPRAGTQSLVPLLTVALVCKGLGCLVRYGVTFGVYDGQADATAYHNAGVALAPQFRRGDFSVDLGTGSASTHFVKFVTGLVYAVIGPSKAGGFLVFSVASFWGLYLAFRAFQIAVPSGDSRRYILLVFFLPSLLFWPSSLGKEAWMMLALGLTAYGAARLLSHRRVAYTPLLVGLVAASAVRPHVAVLAVVALVGGYIVRPRRGRGVFGGYVGKAFGMAVLVTVGILAVGQLQDAMHLNDGDPLTQALDVAQARTDEGGSSFDAPRVHSVADMPWAAVTVLFRPFPYEAGNAQGLVSSMEGLVLMGLFVGSWRRLAQLPRYMMRNPFVAFALVYSLIFVFAFSTFGNFGIITRQRVQVFPFVLVLLCLPKREPRPQPAFRTTIPAMAAR
jgi:hypothetical protein